MGGRPQGRETGPRALGVGVIGATGFIGAVHAHAARRAGGRLVGVAASNPERAERAARDLGAEQAFADAEALIASPEVHVVHVCTPNALHAPLAEAALLAGKHVVCEKPLALDGAQARRLELIAEGTGRVATVPFVYRFYPVVREARAQVADDFGPVRLVHGAYLQDWLSTADDDNWRVDAAASGPSRAFADIGSHLCDLIEFVTGDRLASVCADLSTVVPERRDHGPHVAAFDSAGEGNGQAPLRAVTTEDQAVLLFRTQSGVTGSLVVSQVAPGHKNGLRFEVSGSDTTLGFDQEHPDTLWMGRRVGSSRLDRDPAALHPEAAAYITVPPGHPQGYQECFDGFVRDSYRAIAEGVGAVDGLPTFADGARAAEITDAVLRSSAAGAWTPVEAATPERAAGTTSTADTQERTA